MKTQVINGLSLVSGFLFAIAGGLHAEPEIKGTPTELATYLASVPGTVQILGEGEIKLAADRAIVSLRVTSENKSLAEALKENQNTRARVTKFLKEQGIDADRVQATPFSSTQKQAIFSDKVKSHKVSAVLKVTTKDEEEFRAVTKAVDQFTDVAYVQAEFEHSEKEALKARATSKACDEVERQKRLYEEKLGVKLTVRNIENQTQSAGPIPARRYGDGYGKYPSASMSYSTPLASGGDVGEVGEDQTPFGELVFSARLAVVYAVERK